MQVLLEIKRISDLEILLPLLKRLQINVLQSPKLPENPKEKRPLADFWGSIPTLNANAFEDYLNETRNEWDRPTF